LLVLSQLLAASLNSGSTMIEFALHVLGRPAYSGDLVLESCAGGLYVRNCGI
jgi:hypothetical protein